MDLIGVEFTCAHALVHVGARFTPYHFVLRDYVFLAQCVTRVCHQRLGGADALTDMLVDKWIGLQRRHPVCLCTGSAVIWELVQSVRKNLV